MNRLRQRRPWSELGPAAVISTSTIAPMRAAVAVEVDDPEVRGASGDAAVAVDASRRGPRSRRPTRASFAAALPLLLVLVQHLEPPALLVVRHVVGEEQRGRPRTRRVGEGEQPVEADLFDEGSSVASNSASVSPG